MTGLSPPSRSTARRVLIACVLSFTSNALIITGGISAYPSATFEAIDTGPSTSISRLWLWSPSTFDDTYCVYSRAMPIPGPESLPLSAAELNRNWLERAGDYFDPKPSRPEDQVMTFRKVGWPRRCVWSGWWELESVHRELGIVHVRVPHPFYARHLASEFDFPCRPLWSGLLVDAVAHAAIWAVLLFGIPDLILATRRFNRRRRDLCMRCRYDLQGTPQATPCPECGTLDPTRRPPPSTTPA